MGWIGHTEERQEHAADKASILDQRNKGRPELEWYIIDGGDGIRNMKVTRNGIESWE